jgi:23S rRNA (adenine2503-C2)-methyltransferase
MEYILDYTLDSLKELLASWDEKPFRADQIFEWIYKRSTLNPQLMINLPQSLRDRMSAEIRHNPIQVQQILRSSDGSIKVLFKSKDAFFEAVTMPAEDTRNTFCLSVQYGCAIGCKFCETGTMGFKRNLTAAEIAYQVLELEKQSGRPDNIVLMGMGEALLNFQAVDQFINTISDKKGYELSRRRITLSTAGLMKELLEFHKIHPQVELAISLNAPDEKIRRLIMPNNNLAGFKEIIETVKRLDCDVTLEYVLLEGINSAKQNAESLAKSLKGIKNAKVNLIRYNATSREFTSPSREKTVAFQDILRAAGIVCFMRKSMGSDISAACGQLAGRTAK